MAIILFASLTGSPGVTSTTLAVVDAWPRAALVLEADTSKSSSILPGLLRGQVDHSKGLSQLSIAQQRRELTPQAVIDQAHVLAEGRYFVPGFNSATAAAGTTSLWSALGSSLASLDSAGMDVIVDLGRLGPNDPREPLLRIADSLIIITKPVLPDLAALSARVPEIKQILQAAGHDDHLGLWLVDANESIEPYPQEEIVKLLNVKVLGKIRNDSRAAAVWSLGVTPPARFDRTPYTRSIGAAVATLIQSIQERQARLGVRPTAEASA